MPGEYEYTISADTLNGVLDEVSMAKSIKASTISIPFIKVIKKPSDETKVLCLFTADLPGTEKADLLDPIIANHTGVPMATHADKSVVITLNAGEEQQIEHGSDIGGEVPRRVVTVMKKEQTLGANLAPAMTAYDPDAFSTYDSRVNDGNTGNYWFNNSKLGSANKWIGLDAGEGNTVTATHMRWYDYVSSSAYQTTEYKIQGSDDGTNWTDLYHELNPPYSPPLEGHLIDLGGPKTYRYFRWLSISGKNSNYVLVTELELYNVSSEPVWRNPEPTDVQIDFVDATHTCITNKLAVTKTFSINIRVD